MTHPVDRPPFHDLFRVVGAQRAGGVFRPSYFINSVSGSDVADGLTAATAWQSFAPAIALGAGISGKSIGIHRGSSFATAIALTAANVRLMAYGTGSGPTFDSRATLSGWVPQGVFANVYQATATLTANVKNLGNVFLAGVMMPQVSSLALLDAGAVGSCFVSDWTLAAPTVYVKSATNPAVDGSVYTIPTTTVLTISGAGALIEDIRANAGIHQDGMIRIVARNAKVLRSNFTNGGRHCFYAFPGAVLEDCTFGPARNDLEGSANTLIINDTVAVGEGYTSTRCTYTGTGGALVTGPDMHDGTASSLMGAVTHTGDTFVDLISWMTANGAYTVKTPVFNNVTGGATMSVAGYVLSVTGGSGTLDQLYNNTGSGTINSTGGTYTIRTLPVGFYRTNSATADTTLNITNDTLTVQAGPSVSSQVIRHVRGPVAVNGLSVVTNPSGLCAPIDDIIVAGIAATASFSGNGNSYPYGSRFTLNGTAYNTLAAWQTFTGAESTSTLVSPVPVGSDDFTRADENLEATTWARVGGAAAQAAVRSNQLAAIGTTQTLYRFANATNTDHWIDFTVEAIPGTAGPTVVLRASDENNWVGIRWTTTTWQVSRCLAGVLTVSVQSSTAVVPATGQRVILAMKGDAVYLYVDGRTLIRGSAMGATSIGSNTGVGILCRNSTSNPFIDNFKYGTV